jgi:hypothetical protein
MNNNTVPRPPEDYDPDFVASILQAAAAPIVAKFDNVLDLLEWLDSDE